MKSLPPLFFLIALVAQPAQAIGGNFEGKSCVQWILNVVQSEISRQVVPKQVREFDAQAFSTALVEASRSLSQGGTVELSPFPTFEEQLAFVQAHCGRAGTPGLALDQVLCDAGLRKKRELAKIFERARLGRDFFGGPTQTSVERIERLVTDLYRLQYGNDMRALGFWEGSQDLITLRSQDARTYRLLSRAAAEALAKKGLISALEKLNRIGGQTPREAFVKFARDPRTQVLYATLLNTLNAAFMAPFPYLPATRWFQFSEKTLTELLLRGDDAFDLAWAEIEQAYGRRIRWQETYLATFRKAVHVATLVVIGTVTYSQYLAMVEAREQEAETQTDAMVEKLDQVTRELRRQNDQKQSTESFGEELFEQWRQSYIQKHGRAPDPKSAEYREAYRVFVSSTR